GAEAGRIRRGGLGDGRAVLEAFRTGRRWVVGVRGNHDSFEEPESAAAAGMHLLDGSSVTLDGIRLGGVGGVIGNPSKPRMRSEERFMELIRSATGSGIDILVLHEGPEGDDEHARGSRAI